MSRGRNSLITYRTNAKDHICPYPLYRAPTAAGGRVPDPRCHGYDNKHAVKLMERSWFGEVLAQKQLGLGKGRSLG